MSGVFYIGLDDRFDGDKVKAYPPGSVIVLPGNTWHFRWAKSGEYVTQVTAIGPLGLEYMNAKPRNRSLEDAEHTLSSTHHTPLAAQSLRHKEKSGLDAEAVPELARPAE